MPRRKVQNELIADRRGRATTFGRRLDGLKKKAEELSILCGVPVALVCADGEGAAAPFVWESGGALAMYRALPEQARAAHAHRAYADTELGKHVSKLARVRRGGPPALAGWDKALDGADAEGVRRVLEAVDAAIAAAEGRRRELGLPAFQDDSAGLLEGVAPLRRAAPTNFSDEEDYPIHAQGGDHGRRYEQQQQAMWGNAAAMQPAGYGFQQFPGGGCGGGVDMDAYQLQMATGMNGLQMAAGMNGYSNTGVAAWDAFHQPHNASQCYGYGGMSGYHAQQVPSNNGGFQPNLLHNAAVPIGYPSLDIGLGYMDNAQGYAGNFVNNAPPALSHAMGMGTGDNFSNPATAQPLAMYRPGGDLMNPSAGYATQQWPAQQQQIQSASSSQQSHSAGIEQLHYLSDVEDGLQLWGN